MRYPVGSGAANDPNSWNTKTSVASFRSAPSCFDSSGRTATVKPIPRPIARPGVYRVKTRFRNSLLGGVGRCSGVGDVILRSSVWPRYSVTERRSNSGAYTHRFYCCLSTGIAVKRLLNSIEYVPAEKEVSRGPVSRILCPGMMPGWWPSILSSRCRKDHAAYPGIRSGAVLLERRYPSIWPCSGWGFPASRFAPEPGALLPHRFTLACVLR